MRHILTRAYNDKSIACNVTLMMETSPHTMQKAPPNFLMIGNHLQALTGLNFFFSGLIIYMKKITQF